MSIYPYLQLQPVEPSDDGTVSDLDEYQQDETIDLNSDETAEELQDKWAHMLDEIQHDPEKLNFSDE